ncbi:hypothetical protein [uncultured Nitratireductor sp.]|uniref:hypothetical protein n=1 Tax=uncultured Nitratireductor sp. TaxID=520953 RepID=UPI0025F6C45E|nr:hypothetical protein [uncultured Nitratireductor sp.]
MQRISDAIGKALGFAARYGRFFLVAGLVTGIALPAAAHAAKPWIAEMIAALLFLAALRVGPKALIGALGDLRQSLLTTLAFQLLLPLAFALTFLGVGWSGVLPTALVLMAAAAPVSGSPHLAIMTGNDPAPVMRVMTLGTALLPFTVVPVFWLTPALGSADVILAAASRLLGVIALAVSTAFVLRRFALPNPGPATIRSIDGLSAILMGVVVVGLMSAVGETLIVDPTRVGLNLAIAFAANFLLQIAATTLFERSGATHIAAPLGIAAGNRNIGLFLTALPASITDSLLLFIGCYQIPMYLTPLILGRYYRQRAKATAQPHPSN